DVRQMPGHRSSPDAASGTCGCRLRDVGYSCPTRSPHHTGLTKPGAIDHVEQISPPDDRPPARPSDCPVAGRDGSRWLGRLALGLTLHQAMFALLGPGLLAVVLSVITRRSLSGISPLTSRIAWLPPGLSSFGAEFLLASTPLGQHPLM